MGVYVSETRGAEYDIPHAVILSSVWFHHICYSNNLYSLYYFIACF